MWLNTRVSVVYDGVLPPDARPGARERLQQRSDLRSDTFVILVLARIESTKRLDLVLRSVAKVDLGAREVVLLVAGDVVQPEYAIALENQARSLNVNVEWLGFVVDVAELLASCDCVVAVGRGEAAGMSILEAITSAKWIIASVDGGGAELVEEGVTGSVVAPEENALAQALTRAAAGPLQCVPSERLDAWRKRFSADAVGCATMDLYDRCLQW